MLVVSLIINVTLFFLILNWKYISKKRLDPDTPKKPFRQSVIFPLALGIIFTLLVDAFRGIVFYQLLLFTVITIILFWLFYIVKPRK